MSRPDFTEPEQGASVHPQAVRPNKAANATGGGLRRRPFVLG